MSMTVTMNEAGLVALPETVVATFGINGAQQIGLDVEGDGVKLRLGHANDQNTFWNAETTALLKRTSHFRLGVMPTREERSEQ